MRVVIDASLPSELASLRCTCAAPSTRSGTGGSTQPANGRMANERTVSAKAYVRVIIRSPVSCYADARAARGQGGRPLQLRAARIFVAARCEPDDAGGD